MQRALRRRLLAAAVLVAGCAAADPALAQPSADAALAETLFNEAKHKMAAGDYAAACPKLAESYRLDPGSGTLTALAVCHESLGKTASAWTEFIQLVSDARQAGRPDRERFAQQRISALEPKLSKLAIVVEAGLAGLPGFEVRRDGTAVGPAGWGTAAPVDPGEHTVEVRSQGKKPWSTKVTVGAAGDIRTVNVPALDDAVADSPAPDAADAPRPATSIESDAAAFPPTRERGTSSTGSTQRVVGLTLVGIGLVAAGFGTYFGVQAISKNNDVKAGCPDSTSCSDPDVVRTNQDAKSAALAADIAIGGAAAGIVAGALVYFLAPSAASPAASLHLVPVLEGRGASLRLDARW